MPQLKFSRQRESIKENLSKRKDHPTADMVYSDIRQIFPNISLGTVYRNLSLLTEQGELQKIVGEDGVVHFDHNTAPHNHFYCRGCGNVIDMPFTDPISDREKLKAFADDSFEGTVENCSISFSGLCKACAKRS